MLALFKRLIMTYNVENFITTFDIRFPQFKEYIFWLDDWIDKHWIL